MEMRHGDSSAHASVHHGPNERWALNLHPRPVTLANGEDAHVAPIEKQQLPSFLNDQ
jgi:hypothetical protein